MIKGFESRLERMVEGTFAKVFRSELRPVELGRRLTREMDSGRSIGIDGRPIMPNHFKVHLSAPDAGRFAQIQDALATELVEAGREHARSVGARFAGPVSVEFETVETYGTGMFKIDAGLRAGEGELGSGYLEAPTGERHLLTNEPLTFGRLPECDVTVNDPNVSRRHAEVRAEGAFFVVTDLGSTNGTLVNDRPVATRRLVDGDVVGVGATRFVFRLH